MTMVNSGLKGLTLQPVNCKVFHEMINLQIVLITHHDNLITSTWKICFLEYFSLSCLKIVL